MSTKKTEYELLLNSTNKVTDEYPFCYGNYKDTIIKLGPNSLQIHVSTCAKILPDDIQINNNPLFSFALERGLLLLILKYSKPIQLKNVLFRIDGIDYNISVKEFAWDSIITGRLKSRFNTQWKCQPIYNFILGYHESYRMPQNPNESDFIIKGQRRLMAAVEALITAKSKSLQFEKFVYLWMAMNGLYGYAAYIIEPSGKMTTENGKKRNLTESDEMAILWQCSGWVTNGRHWLITNHDKPIIASKVRKILADAYETASLSVLTQQLFDGDYADKIVRQLHTFPTKESTDEAKDYNISARTYLTFFLPYYLRCSYFHANKPLPLLFNKNDEIVLVLTIVNSILEEFLDTQLVNWLDKEYVSNVIISTKANIVYGINL